MIVTVNPFRACVARLFQGLGLTASIVLAGCAGTPTVPADTGAVGPLIEKLPKPLPSKPEQVLELDARDRVLAIALTEGTLVARAERNALLVRGIDQSTATLIDSDIAWLEGEIDTSNRLLSSIITSNARSLDALLAEQQRRAAQTSDWLTAAKLAHRRLLMADSSAQQATLKDALWALLMQLNDNRLMAASLRPDDADWLGWLALANAYREGRRSVNHWLATHSEHTALRPMPSGLDAWLDTPPPEKIALLLPLSGRLAGAGEAVLSGAIETLYRQYPDAAVRPALLTVDTGVYADAIAAYRAAIAQGADVVIGPLTKANAQMLGSLRQRPVPVIALNRPEALPPSDADDWSALSLAPEDEARQLANLAFGRGARRSVIIRPDNDWGRRMEAALQQTWRGLGGRVTTTLALTEEPSASEQISRAVGGYASEARIRAVESAFEAPVEARARRRQDFDSIFLLAQSPAEARSLRPLLVFHYSGDIPVYAPSSIYSGNQHLQNRDLNDVIFVETPAVLDAVTVDRFSRLTALGHDAILTVDHRQQAQIAGLPFLRGNTGLLTRLSNGEIERELIPTQFAGDKIRPLRLP